jgi:hypothetical protein
MDYANKSIEELLECKLIDIANNTTDEQKKVVVEKFFKHYRKTGFPYFNLSPRDIHNEVQKLKLFNVNKLDVGNDEIQQVMHGLSVCNFFHPHMWEIKCRNSLTPMQVYEDDEKFKNALHKRMMMSDSKMKENNVRKALKIFSGAQSVSNFRPTVAKYLYDNYCPSHGVVLDPCMGYGGRVLASYVSNNVEVYHGCDPCMITNKGNRKMMEAVIKSDTSSKLNKFFKQKRKPYEWYQNEVPFEDYETSEKFDFIFTSPPYYNVEKYSDEDTQSWIRYPEYKDWSENFLKVFIKKCYEKLKTGHYFGLNIHGEKLIEDSLRYADDVGFTLDKTLKMRLSKICGKGIDKNVEKFKHEPIFMFKK